MNCSSCGNYTSRSYYGMCQRCYKYYHAGGTDNPLPKIGTIEYDYRGYVICHKCGRAYKRLGSHIKESHDMTIAEYKAEFEICNCTKTTEKQYSHRMRELAYKNDIPNRLQIAGIPTRIKPGEGNLRRGKDVRLQERIERSARMLERNKED